MNERYQVNVRLDRDLIEEIDRMAREDAIDRSEMSRRLLSAGLRTRRMQRAIEEYRQGNVTAWRAAEMAGVSLYEMLDRIHEAGIPHELDEEVLGRVEATITSRRAVHEERAPYGDERRSRRGRPDAGARSAVEPPAARRDADTGIDDLREQFRPSRARILFVGESSPAGGTHFYRANSNLFRATLDAFAQAFGEDEIPDGPRFLREFQDRGCWLVDLADRPVDRLADAERRTAVQAGIESLARRIAEVRPERIVVVKATIAGPVREAVEMAGLEAEVLALPFPVRQWRAVFVRQLAAALRRWTQDVRPTRQE
jgi:predicted HTH domain antitoxin